MKMGIFLMIIGASLIAGGGILTTLGWDCISQYKEKKALLRAIAADWVYNNKVGIKSGGTWRLKSEDPNIAQTPSPPYPFLRDQGITQGTISEHITPKSNPKLPETLMSYLVAIQHYNRLVETRNTWAPAVIKVQGIKSIPEQFKVLRESLEYLHFEAEHSILSELLERQFPGLLTSVEKNRFTGVDDSKNEETSNDQSESTTGSQDNES
ncbi:MAG: hypothetical protein JW828_13840 [Sedimentisphaerales bacterium]|nr:hypothetical protein [Sedimentisphaerales bacterium]